MIGPSSTSSPAYITPMRSQIRTTVPRLWLMKMMAVLCLLAQPRDQVEHGGFDRHVEAGGRLVHHQQRGLGHQRHGDHHALLLAARELVRIALDHGLAGRAG